MIGLFTLDLESLKTIFFLSATHCDQCGMWQSSHLVYPHVDTRVSSVPSSSKYSCIGLRSASSPAIQKVGGRKQCQEYRRSTGSTNKGNLRRSQRHSKHGDAAHNSEGAQSSSDTHTRTRGGNTALHPEQEMGLSQNGLNYF